MGAEKGEERRWFAWIESATVFGEALPAKEFSFVGNADALAALGSLLGSVVTGFHFSPNSEPVPVKRRATRLRTVSIVEHPEFHVPKFDWGVISAWVDPETGEEIPEDRSGWRREWDGKSMADFWDGSRFVWDGPQSMQGVTTYLKIEVEES